VALQTRWTFPVARRLCQTLAHAFLSITMRNFAPNHYNIYNTNRHPTF